MVQNLTHLVMIKFCHKERFDILVLLYGPTHLPGILSEIVFCILFFLIFIMSENVPDKAVELDIYMLHINYFV